MEGLMDQNAELFVSKAGQPKRWEDEEKATNDVAELRKEFRSRLYAEGQTHPPGRDQNGPARRDAK
jgi:hypothetical protein